ncbi:MAG: hypothetical protein PVJ66_05485 [Gammaproteobacteria bacterium]
MVLLPLISQLLFLSAAVALVWLAARAFAKHPAWGVAVLLLSPVSAAIFGIRYWQTEKVPLVAYMGSFCIAVSFGAYLFMAWGGGGITGSTARVNEGIQSNTLSEADAAGFMNAGLHLIENAEAARTDPPEGSAGLENSPDPAVATAGDIRKPGQAAEAGEAAGAEVEKKPKPVRTRLAYVPVRVSEAQNYVGHTVKVKRRNVPEKEYRLTGATGHHLEFTQHKGGGSFTFRYRDSDIEKIRVLVKQAY